MPKKHHKPTTPKPQPTVHPSLGSFTSRSPRNEGPKADDGRSVNDLIRHLRRTQLPGSDEANAGPSHVAPRSVHPSIRNLLELPETPPPRPRPGAQLVRRVGERTIRRTPGPSAPMSWLVSNTSTDRDVEQDSRVESDKTLYKKKTIRLDHLPGIDFPPATSLQHMVLKSMARRWDGHLLYDGVFLSELPTHIKQLLLSYIAKYTDHAEMEVGMQGLKPLFLEAVDDDEDLTEPDSDITRLDLCSAIGRWLSLKELTREVKGPVVSESRSHKEHISPPSSWEDETDAPHPSPIPSIHNQPAVQRFQNLKFLSLANPIPAQANWPSLLSLVSNLSTITHLSLAHWPTPTLTPNSLKASIKDPQIRHLSFAYGGTDIYSASDNNWVEAAGVLRRLSKATYCLKWLGLQGCNTWIPALSWNGIDAKGDFHPTTGPEWNGSWRGVEWLGLGPGWFPDISDQTSYIIYEVDRMLRQRERMGGFATSQPAQVEKYGRMMRNVRRRDEYRALIDRAVEVRKEVREIRRGGGGKWLEVSFGPESEDESRVRVCGDKVK
ncbi:hypothetical protein FQN55_005040 [Onygenales sp. PD_40]|nr:hypothetical protein FQN55_005040 [Onygenales sp. PD_40]